MLTKELSKLPALRPSFIEPIHARAVSELSEDNLWSYEAKLDGYRCLAAKHSGAQIEFTEWTPDQHLRHASFAGLRDDKEAFQRCRFFSDTEDGPCSNQRPNR